MDSLAFNRWYDGIKENLYEYRDDIGSNVIGYPLKVSYMGDTRLIIMNEGTEILATDFDQRVTIARDPELIRDFSNRKTRNQTSDSNRVRPINESLQEENNIDLPENDGLFVGLSEKNQEYDLSKIPADFFNVDFSTMKSSILPTGIKINDETHDYQENLNIKIDPIHAILDKSKIEDIEIDIKLCIKEMKPDLFKVLSESFEGSKESMINYLVSKIDMEAIKISIKKYYESKYI